MERARDEVARQVGLGSGRTYERARLAVLNYCVDCELRRMLGDT